MHIDQNLSGPLPAQGRRGLGKARAPDVAQPVRRKRLIAGCRVTLAAFSLLALWLDPAVPESLAPLAVVLVALYAAWSVLVAVFAWRARSTSELVPLICHGVDIGFFTLAVLLTEGWTSSPFFLSLVFVLAAATVRWQQAGVIVTALVLLAALLATSLYLASTATTGFELNEFITRSIHLGVVAVLLGYLGAFQQRLRDRLAALSPRTESLPTDTEGCVRHLLEHISLALNAPRVVLAWEQPGESWSSIASWEAGMFDLRRQPREGAERLAPLTFEETPFLASATPAHDGRFKVLLAGGDTLCRKSPVPGWLRNRFNPDHTLSAPVQGTLVAGRLYVLDPRDAISDELVLADGLARQLAASLDQLLMFERAHQVGLMEERIRLAGDLHDGVIQSLAAAALRLEATRYLVDGHPYEAGRAIGEVEELLESEQQELRDIVAALQPEDCAKWSSRPLAERLERLVARLRRHWHIEAELSNRLEAAEIPDSVGRDIFWIVREALVNAAQHGRASRARVSIDAADGMLHLAIEDNGGGFRFQGRHDFATLRHSQLGPYHLGQRVAALGGQLEINSGTDGAGLYISVPQRRTGEAA